MISELEKIFEAMDCLEDKKVTYATFMLKEEAQHWWTNNRRLVEIAGVAVGWDDFKAIFLEKYFPADVRNLKETEFLMLQQGNMTVAKYATKFEELSQYSTSFQGVDGEQSRCVKGNLLDSREVVIPQISYLKWVACFGVIK